MQLLALLHTNETYSKSQAHGLPKHHDMYVEKPYIQPYIFQYQEVFRFVEGNIHLILNVTWNLGKFTPSFPMTGHEIHFAIFKLLKNRHKLYCYRLLNFSAGSRWKKAYQRFI